jgi:glycerophosphoryl diester phosphodiesterase
MPPLICAHRGSSGHAPENTLSALDLAVEHGAGQVEVDVQLTADGQAVLIHDETLNRTTSGKGLVAEHTLEQLRLLDAGTWFGREWAGEKLPTLEEVLVGLGDRVTFNLELKGAAGQALEDEVTRLVKAHGLADRCLLTSFDHSRIGRLADAGVDIQLGFIVGQGTPWRELLSGPAQVLSVEATVVDAELVAAAHQAGKQVQVWTLNTAAEFRMVMEMKVDAIITNFPDRLQAFLGSRKDMPDRGPGR